MASHVLPPTRPVPLVSQCARSNLSSAWLGRQLDSLPDRRGQFPARASARATNRLCVGVQGITDSAEHFVARLPGVLDLVAALAERALADHIGMFLPARHHPAHEVHRVAHPLIGARLTSPPLGIEGDEPVAGMGHPQVIVGVGVLFHAQERVAKPLARVLRPAFVGVVPRNEAFEAAQRDAVDGGVFVNAEQPECHLLDGARRETEVKR